ncbi:MAG: hypothetical protein KAI57_02865 [Candidatus Pacebacteria bacterium]|nr:hypothetical protein [Candidatus Paceibacterota bacterium]
METPKYLIEESNEFNNALMAVKNELNSKDYNWSSKKEVDGEFYINISEINGPNYAKGKGSSYEDAFKDGIDKLDEKIREELANKTLG